MEYIVNQLTESGISHTITDTKLGDETLPVVTVLMPDGVSEFQWMPLPGVISRNVAAYKMSDDIGIYHHLKPSAAFALQPRRTICYDHVYNYSKTQHPVEPVTPDHIKTLYSVTNELYGLGSDGVNMDLGNYYPTGRHHINAHSDNEKQFGRLKDVYCWVFGPASRLGVFRDLDGKEVLSLHIPEGLYVMRGLSFQRHYTHEFPELYPALFKRMCKYITLDGFPRDVPKTSLGAPQTSLVQADWIKANREVMRDFIRGGNISKGAKIDADLANFDEWCLDRTSHTLRQFIVT